MPSHVVVIAFTLNAPVGLSFTFTITELLISVDSAIQDLSSDNAVNEYVEVEDGDTLNE